MVDFTNVATIWEVSLFIEATGAAPDSMKYVIFGITPPWISSGLSLVFVTQAIRLSVANAASSLSRGFPQPQIFGMFFDVFSYQKNNFFFLDRPDIVLWGLFVVSSYDIFWYTVHRYNSRTSQGQGMAGQGKATARRTQMLQ